MPNQTSKNAGNAFMLGKEFNSSNTKVKNIEGVTILSLFENDIAFNDNGKISITNCGFKTNTTKDRLNAIDNVDIQKKKGVWYLNSKQWDGKLTKI